MSEENKVRNKDVAPPGTRKEVSERIQNATAKTKEAFQEVQQKIDEYDKKIEEEQKSKADGEKASMYLRRGIDDAKAALDDLSNKAETLKDENAEIPVKALSRAIAALGSALERVKQMAKKYDEKYQISTKVYDTVNPARERCMQYLSEVSHYTVSAAKEANAQLQGVHDSLRSRLLEYADSSMQYLVDAAAGLDYRHDIGGKLRNTAKQIDEKAKELDKRMGIAEKAKELDEKYSIHENAETLLEKAKKSGRKIDELLTSGKGEPLLVNAYETGVKMISEGLEKLQTEFEEAKHKRECSGQGTETKTA